MNSAISKLIISKFCNQQSDLITVEWAATQMQNFLTL